VRRHWFEVASAEQTIVSGVTDEGAVIKPKKLLEKVKEALDHATGDDRLRLVALYMIVMGGLDDAEQAALVDALSGPQQDALTCFAQLGVPLGRRGKPAKRNKAELKEAQAVAKKCENRMQQLSRVRPRLAATMEALLEDTLSRDAFPYVMEPPPAPEDLMSISDGASASSAWQTPTAAAARAKANSGAGGAGGGDDEHKHVHGSRRSSYSHFSAKATPPATAPPPAGTPSDRHGKRKGKAKKHRRESGGASASSSSSSSSSSDSDSDALGAAPPVRRTSSLTARMMSRFDSDDPDEAPLEATLTATTPRHFVFVVGGMTHSEMAAAYSVGLDKQADLVIGSTHVLTPHSFLREVSLLEPDDL